MDRPTPTTAAHEAGLSDQVSEPPSALRSDELDGWPADADLGIDREFDTMPATCW